VSELFRESLRRQIAVEKFSAVRKKILRFPILGLSHRSDVEENGLDWWRSPTNLAGR
jgi:hypothetical protein